MNITIGIIIYNNILKYNNYYKICIFHYDNITYFD